MKRLQKAPPSVCESEKSTTTVFKITATDTDKDDISITPIGRLDSSLSTSTSIQMGVPHLQPLVRVAQTDNEHNASTLPPENVSDNFNLHEFDPFHPIQEAKVTTAEPSSDLMGLGLAEALPVQRPLLAPSTPDKNIQMGIMEKVDFATSYIANVNRLITKEGIAADVLLGAVTDASNASNTAKSTLKASDLPDSVKRAAVQSLDMAFESMGERVREVLQGSCGSGIRQ